MVSYGRELLKINGELGLHGYNHQPLAPAGYNQVDLDYKHWEDTKNMEQALTELKNYITDVYPDYEFRSYVPPSNILSPEGRAAIRKVFPSVNIFCALYDGAYEEKCYYQDYDRLEDGTYNIPRYSAGFVVRDDLYWTFYDSDEKIKVTSDDVVFWYNEIVGDPEFQSSGYNGQFISMPDGSQAHIDMEKIDDRTFVFRYPRIISEPLLHCNMDFGPRFIYEKAKKEGGVQGVKSICSINMNPKELPSIGRNYLVEYFPGQRLVYKRNPHFWEKDINGVAVAYPEEMIVNIVSDRNTEFLLFNEGKLEGYSPRPEELTDVVNNSGKDYTVFNGGGSLGSGLWSFNQNPVNKDKPFYNWFTKKEFRQAMSCLLNRDRIISQAYRGMGVPNYYFFPEPNPFFNPEITLQYRFDLERASELLSKCGMTKKSDGWLYDQDNNLVEFDLTISGDDSLTQDIASIISDECSKVGVKVKIKTLDFQKVVEQLTATYDWQSVIIGLGVAIWPTQGSNVWPSDGNLHLWYPLQSSPATEWEAKIDELYDEGSCTLDKKKAQKIWDEYQSLILEQCPVIYLIRSQSFYAIRNRWDLSNMYFDNMGGANTSNLFLKEEL